ncbi:MAG: ABC transporter substrate-binding protein, partial [Anaerolineales bacterium]|nr:ABC transporter substrate-binding protein [Anaerolineales bacterium]
QQDDTLALGGSAFYEAVSESYGRDLFRNEFFDWGVTDFAPIVSSLIADDPDMIHLGASYPNFVILLMEQLYLQGYDGDVQGATFDQYQNIIDKTSVEFLEGFAFDFPDFDDALLTPEQNAFADEYNLRFPGEWSAVAWEYAAILDTWVDGVRKADSIESIDVFNALKSSPTVRHPFGEGRWWGDPYYGNDNVLIGPWPIVEMRDGKATIVEFRDQLDWWYRDNNNELAIKWSEEYDIMWWQRLGVPKEEAYAQFDPLG